MQRVITINLNGNAYQLDESGYDALRAYLETAALKLKDNPDKAEIIADLEQAIADKCVKVLSPGKTVVTAEEVMQIIGEMGPVEAGDANSQSAADSAQAKPGNDTGSPRRLYQIREGAMISGVCNGIAAYWGMDVTIVRILFVVLAILTSGVWLLAYIVMMFVIPCAGTSEETAAAFGLPFNAQELIERAKQHYANFKGSDWREHKRHWRQQRREWRQQRREWRRKWRMESRWWPHNVQQPAEYAGRVTTGMMVPLLGLISAAFSLLWLLSLISLVTTGAIFGWPLPDEMPVWVGVVLLLFVFNVVAWPLRAARRASYHAASGYSFGWFEIWGRILWFGFLVLFSWLAYRYVPEVHYFIDSLPQFWEDVVG